MFTTKNLEDCLDLVDLFLDDMETKWLEKGGGEGLKASLIDKVLSCKDDEKISGIVLFQGDMPAGIAWAETSTRFYGNIVLHSLDSSFDIPLAKAICDQSYFDDHLLEVVIVDLESAAMTYFREQGLVENKRRRMSFWLEDTPQFQPVFSDIVFRPITDDDKHYTGTLSFSAHQLSRDYDMYPEMTIFDLRKKMEDYLYNDGYGPVIHQASLIASLNDTNLGYIMMVEVPCWGFEKMPWVFDICVKPDFHGKGLGRALLYESINQLIALKYPVLGLAVTETNPAVHLYEKAGFQFVDQFSEFIRPKTSELYPRLTL